MSRFSDYLQKTFDFSPEQSEEVIAAMRQPLGKSIRVNTRKITLENFKLHAKEQGWKLTDTAIPEVFLIDRDDTTIALGNTIEHRAGWFYIQEVAAAHPPHLLREQIGKNEGIEKILDMCAAPGGKTTQLADYFPDSLIIANEVNRTRTPQLFENLDRMGYDNIAVVSCDGRFFQNFPDFFDAVLLDAPCSGEGTAFRDNSIIEHWHEKNIDRIAKLQKQLIETADTVLKPGGTLSYSTCTLNVMENEEVIDHELVKDTLIEKMRKRFWPHIEHTGGFFASIFEKKKEAHTAHTYTRLALRGQKPIVRPATKGEYELVERFIAKHFQTKLKSGHLFFSKDALYYSTHSLTNLSEYFYFVHAGMKIGTVKKNSFEPTHHLYWSLQDTQHVPTIEITDDMIYKKMTGKASDGWYGIKYGQGIIGIGEIQSGCYNNI